MREIVLRNNKSNRRIFVDEEKPDFFSIPEKGMDLFVALLEIEMYEHFKKRRKRKTRDKPDLE